MMSLFKHVRVSESIHDEHTVKMEPPEPVLSVNHNRSKYSTSGSKTGGEKDAVHIGITHHEYRAQISAIW